MTCTTFAKGSVLTRKDLPKIESVLRSKYKKASTAELEHLAYEAAVEHNRTEMLKEILTVERLDILKPNNQFEYHNIVDIEYNQLTNKTKIITDKDIFMFYPTVDGDMITKEGYSSQNLTKAIRIINNYNNRILHSKILDDSDIENLFSGADLETESILNANAKLIEIDNEQLKSSFDIEHSNKLTNIIERIYNINKDIKNLKIGISTKELEKYIEPFGVFDDKSKDSKIKILAGSLKDFAKNRLLMTNQEVLAHETIHAALNFIFKNKYLLTNKEYISKAYKFYKIAKNKLSYKDFLIDPDNSTSLEIEKAKELYNYMFEYDKNSNTSINAERRLQEFLAIGATNARVNKALNKIRTAETLIPEESTDSVFDTIFKKIINYLYTLINKLKNDRTLLGDSLINLVVDMAKIQASANSKAAMTLGTKLDYTTNKIIDTTLSKADKEISILLDKLFKKVGLTPTKNTKDDLQKVKVILDNLKQEYLQVKKSNVLRKLYFLTKAIPQLRIVYQLSQKDNNVPIDIMISYSSILNQLGIGEDSFFQRLIADFTTGRATLEKLEDLSMSFRSHVGRLRHQGYINTLKDIISNFKHTDLYSPKGLKYNQALTSLLKLDIQAIKNISFNELQKLVYDKAYRDQRIKNIEKSLQSDITDYPMPNYLSFVKKEAKRLANYIGTGKGLRTNAFNIARLFGTQYRIAYSIQNKLKNYDINKAAELIDELASLYALDYVNQNEFKLLEELYERDKDGIDRFIALSRGNQKAVQEDWVKSKTIQQAVKGQLHIQYNKDRDLKYASLRDRQLMQELGYKLIKKIIVPVNENKKTAEFGLYVSYNTGLNSRIDGAVGLQRIHREGISLLEIIRKEHPSLTDFDQWLIFQDMLNNALQYITKYNFQPEYDNEGRIIDLYLEYDNKDKEKYLEIENRGTEILSSSWGQYHTQPMNDENNKKVLDILYKDMELLQNTKEDVSHLFVHVRPYENTLSQQNRLKLYKENNKDFVMTKKYGIFTKGEEIWALLPPTMKDEIIKRNNEIDIQNGKTPKNRKELYIRKDILPQLLGYNDPSITDLKIFHNVSVKTLNKITTFENYYKDIIALLKANIVVKMPKVLIGNILSNIKFLWYAGMPLQKVLKYAKLSKESLSLWKADEKMLLQYERELLNSTSEKDKKKYKVLIADVKASMRNNPLYPLMEAGLWQTVVDDVIVENEQNRTVKLLKEKTVEKLKHSKLLYDSIQTLFLTRQSMLGSLLVQATQESDFHFRSMLYWYYTNDKKMSSKEALKEVKEDFINYNRVINSKFIQWLDRTGFEAFWKYFSNIQRITIKKLKYRSSRVLTDFAAQKLLDAPSGIYQSSIAFQLPNRLSPLDKVENLFDSGTNIPLLHLLD